MAKHPIDGYDFTSQVPRGTPLLVQDYTGNVWRLSTKGVRYHSDVSTLLHGARPAKAPPALAASIRIRALIARVLKEGRGAELPVSGDPDIRWTDQRPGSYASMPYLEVWGDVARAVRPVYDDAPHVGAIRLAKRELAKLQADVAIAPVGVHVPEVSVTERTVDVDLSHPLATACAGQPGVRDMYRGGPLVVPVTTWRRIKESAGPAGGEAAR